MLLVNAVDYCILVAWTQVFSLNPKLNGLERYHLPVYWMVS